MPGPYNAGQSPTRVVLVQPDNTDYIAGGAGAPASKAQIVGNDGITNAVVASTTDGSGNTNPSVHTVAKVSLFNGTSWDRGRSIDAVAAGTGMGVISTAIAPHSAASGALASSATSVVASSLILKASAGNLYGFNVVSGASAGYLLIYDSATVPADGATTPKRAYVIAANASMSVSFEIPRRFASGIVLVFSTTGPFLKTASPTAFLSGEFV